MLKLVLLITTLLCSVLSCFAQADKIDADRPDQTESPVTMPKKWMQLELGFGRQVTSATEKEYQHPSLLCRYGIVKKIELRLNMSAVTNTDFSDPLDKQKESGLSPVEVGTKIGLWEEKKLLPKTSLLFHVVIPKLASKHLQANLLAPSFKIAMQNTISSIVGIGYNVGAEWDGFSNKPTWLYTFSTGFNIGENGYSFIEVYGFISKQNAPEHSIDGGFAYFLSSDLKVDISAGFGISKAAPDWYFGFGGSFRFKTGK